MPKWVILVLVGTLLAQFPVLSASSAYNSPTAYSISWLKNEAEAFDLSRSSSKPVLILFTGTSWCPACMALDRQVLNQPEFIQAVAHRFVFLRAEFGAGAFAHSPYKPLADRYQIQSFPTFVVANSRGDLLYKVNYHEGSAQTYANELLQKLR